jgi:hypothetical protein
MPTITKNPTQIKSTVSYGKKECLKLKRMEQMLMEHYGYDYSQLHKVLVRERYNQIRI